MSEIPYFSEEQKGWVIDRLIAEQSYAQICDAFMREWPDFGGEAEPEEIRRTIRSRCKTYKTDARKPNHEIIEDGKNPLRDADMRIQMLNDVRKRINRMSEQLQILRGEWDKESTAWHKAYIANERALMECVRLAHTIDGESGDPPAGDQPSQNGSGVAHEDFDHQLGDFS